MRTNAIDALAYRCHAEFKTLMEILYDLEHEMVEGHHEEVCDHWAAMNAATTLRDIRAAHELARDTLVRNIKEATKVLKMPSGEAKP